MTIASKFIIFGMLISCANIIPTSIFCQFSLPLARSGHFGDLLDATGEDTRQKLIESALQGQDVSVGLFLQQSGWPLSEIENFLIELVATNVRSKVILSIIRDYVLSSGNYTLIGETFKYAGKSIVLDEIIFLFIDRELQRAVAQGNCNYVYYIFNDPTCQQHISLVHIENAFKNLLRCPNNTQQTLDVFLRHQWALRVMNKISDQDDPILGG
ncbi:MAG: hypothetical protein WCW33_03310 [Candidatus Babeliales bacterium]|jgi:hypothetical protein